MGNIILGHIYRSTQFLIFTAYKKKISVRIVLCLILLCVSWGEHSYAEVWTDSFDGDELIGWKRFGRSNTWHAKWDAVEGFLFASIQNAEVIRPTCEEYAGDFLHWNIIEFNFEQLTIVGEEITYPQEGWQGMGELCLFIGKRQDDPDAAIEGYLVSPEEISRVTLSETGRYSRGKTKAWYGDIFQDTTHNLTAVFDSGLFQVWTNDELITEFFDENIKSIDIVGLIITCHKGGIWFGSRMSNISITDEAIKRNPLDVKLQSTQLATTWGGLKRF